MTRSISIPIPFLRDGIPRSASTSDLAKGAHDAQLALREISGNLALSADGVYAWYRDAPVRWSFMNDSACEQVITGSALVWAGLLEDAHTRILPRPHPASVWAAEQAKDIGPVSDPALFDSISESAQQYVKRTTLANVEVYRGFKVADRALAGRILSGARKGLSEKERDTYEQASDAVAQKVAATGVGAQAIDGADLEWLIDRSVGLGLPQRLDAALGHPIGEDDMDAFTDDVDHIWHPGRQYTEVIGLPSRNGKEIRRFVSIISLGRTEELTIPQKHKPWLAHAQSLPFEVQFSLRHRTLPTDEAVTRVGRKLDVLEDQVSQYRKHNLDQPPEVPRLMAQGVHLRDTMANAHELDSTWVETWVRAAVFGSTAKECLANARAFKEHYRKLRMKTHLTRGQRTLYREFTPCEPLASTSYRRNMRVKFFAAGVPNLSTGIGHKNGFLFGHSATVARNTWTWNLWHAMEELDKSGYTPVVGGLGSGKTSLGVGAAYLTATADIDVTALDPSVGGLAELCYLPELRDRALHVDLSQPEKGRLAPFGVIGDPRRDQFYEHPSVRTALREGASKTVIEQMVTHRFQEAGRRTNQLRKLTAVSNLLQMLPLNLREDADVAGAIRAAVRPLEGVRTDSLDDVLANLPKADSAGATRSINNARDQLIDMQEFPQTSLFFGQFPDTGGERPRLLVITLPGVTPPDERKPEGSWDEEERLTVPMFTNAAAYALRRVYSKPMRERHLVIADEAHKFRRFSAGRTLFDQGARDSRKWNTKFLMLTQKPDDMRELEAEGLIYEILHGRAEEPEIAESGLRLMSLPSTYERDIRNLSNPLPNGKRLPYREFVARIGDDVELVRNDWRYLPQIAPAINASAAKDHAVAAPTVDLVKRAA